MGGRFSNRPPLNLNMETIIEQKKALRKQVRALKREMSPSLAQVESKKVISELDNLAPFNSAKVIMAFWSMDDEIDIKDAIIRWSKTKRVILPVVDGDRLLLKEFTGLSELKPGDLFSIPEPVGSEIPDPSVIDLIVVPGVAFSRKLQRMGRGKAYYDHLLESLSALRVGICYSCQLFDNIPCEPHDLAMDYVITPDELIYSSLG